MEPNVARVGLDPSDEGTRPAYPSRPTAAWPWAEMGCFCEVDDPVRPVWDMSGRLGLALDTKYCLAISSGVT